MNLEELIQGLNEPMTFLHYLVIHLALAANAIIDIATKIILTAYRKTKI